MRRAGALVSRIRRARDGDRHSRARRALRGALIGLAAGGAAALLAWGTPVVENFERRTLDLRSRLFADARRADPGIVAVVIDQRSLDAVAASRDRGGLEQGWPWPRDFYAAVLDYLFQAGARAVAFDLLFTERSIYTQLGVAEDDERLATATRSRPVVHATMFTRETEGAARLPDRAWPAGFRARGHRVPGIPEASFNKATLPIAALREAAAALGWIGFEPDEDGTCRSLIPAAPYAPLGSVDAVEVWSLPLALAAVAGVLVERVGALASEGVRVAGRAEAVKRALVTEHGIAAERLATVGHGASQPIASNDTPDGRAANRRVELVNPDHVPTAPVSAPRP